LLVQFYFCRVMLFVAALEVACSHDWCILTVDDLLHIHTLILSQLHTGSFTRSYTHTNTRTQTHTNTRTQTHTNTHKHTHTNKHKHKHTHKLLLYPQCFALLFSLFYDQETFKCQFLIFFGISNLDSTVKFTFIIIIWILCLTRPIIFYCQIFEHF